MKNHFRFFKPIIACSKELSGKYTTRFERVTNVRPHFFEIFFFQKWESVLCGNDVEIVGWKFVFVKSRLYVKKFTFCRNSNFSKLFCYVYSCDFLKSGLQ